MIATILLVAITVVLAAVLYVMSLGLVGGNSITPLIGATKSVNDDSDHLWTVNAITGGGSIPQENIFVQLQNASGFVISTEPLFTSGNVSGCNGTHGFHYSPATTAGFIAVGDVFFLDEAYGQGCILTLVDPSATSLYARFTI